MIILGGDFQNGTRQEEKVTVDKYDRHESESYILKDLGVKFYLFNYEHSMVFEDPDDEYSTFLGFKFDHLTPEIGSYWIKQDFPCAADNSTCINSKIGFQSRYIEFKNCSSEVSDELHAYYKKRNKLFGDFARQPLCVNDSDLYIKGDPFSWNTQASFDIFFESCEPDDERRRLNHLSLASKRKRSGKKRKLQEDEDEYDEDYESYDGEYDEEDYDYDDYD